MSRPQTISHSRLQSLSVKTQYPYLQPLKWNRAPFSKHTRWSLCLNSPYRLLGLDDTRLRQKLRISVLINTGPAAKLLSSQRHNGYHFVIGANFEEHRSNISTDVLGSVMEQVMTHKQKRKYL